MIPIRKTTGAHPGSIVLDDWIMPYGVLESIMTDTGPQFIEKVSNAARFSPVIQLMAIWPYHSRRNGQTELHNSTIIHKLRHCVSEPQNDWDDYVQPLTYRYNAQVRNSTCNTPFGETSSREPPVSANIV